MHELLHRRLGGVGPESGLLSDPGSAFPSDGALSKLVAQLDLEFRAVEAAFAAGLWNEELPTFLPEAVGHLGGHEGWGRENELQAVDLRELGLQSFECVDRETRRGDPQARPAANRDLEVIPEQVGGVIDDLHVLPPDLGARSASHSAASLRDRYQVRGA